MQLARRVNSCHPVEGSFEGIADIARYYELLSYWLGRTLPARNYVANRGLVVIKLGQAFQRGSTPMVLPGPIVKLFSREARKIIFGRIFWSTAHTCKRSQLQAVNVA